MARGAKEKLNKSDIPKCAQLKQSGLNDKDIAAYIGVCPQTFSTWVNHPNSENQRELSEALKKAEAQAKAAALSKIQKAGMEGGSWQALAWWLERKFPHEFAKPEVQLQREQMQQSTEQMLESFENVIVKIKEAADGDRADS